MVFLPTGAPKFLRALLAATVLSTALFSTPARPTDRTNLQNAWAPSVTSSQPRDDVPAAMNAPALLPDTDVAPTNAAIASPFPESLYAAAVEADGPVAYWRFEEGTGTVAGDSIGPVDGEISGATWISDTGVRGSSAALRLDGSDDHVYLGQPDALTTPAYTAETWVRAGPVSGLAYLYRSRWWGSGLNIEDDGTAFAWYSPDCRRSNVVEIFSPQRIDDGEWHHVVVTMDTTALVLYVDGVEAARGSGASQVCHDRGHFGFGRDANLARAHLDGDIDEFAWYDRALTPNDIRTHYCIGLDGGCGPKGAFAANEVDHTVSCLAGNGRVDINIVNTRSSTGTYRVEFEGLTAREATVQPADFARIRLTGRPDGAYNVLVKRDNVVVDFEVVEVSCDSAPPRISDDELRVVNACRAGNGYVRFQVTNPTPNPRAYVIKFSGVRNRSLTVAGWGQAIRSVTGRPDGTYDITILADGVISQEFSVRVDCDPCPEPHAVNVLNQPKSRTVKDDGNGQSLVYSSPFEDRSQQCARVRATLAPGAAVEFDATSGQYRRLAGTDDRWVLASRLDNEHDLQVIYFPVILPAADVALRREAKLLEATNLVFRQWSEWGWTVDVNQSTIRLNPLGGCPDYDFNAFDDIGVEVVASLGDDFSPTTKYLIFGECVDVEGVGQAELPGNISVYETFIITNIDADIDSEIGAIGHEVGHNFGLFHEWCETAMPLTPSAAQSLSSIGGDPNDLTNGPMCNGAGNDNGGWPNVSPDPYQFTRACEVGREWIDECP